MNRGEAAYLTDAALLDRLFDEKLQQLIEDVRAEGWQGVEIDNDYYTLNSRYPDRIYAKPRALTEAEEDELSTLKEEYDGLVARHNEEPDRTFPQTSCRSSPRFERRLRQISVT
jgi:hypothetical protein